MGNPRVYHKELKKKTNLVLKWNKKFRSEKHNVFTEEAKKMALSVNGDRRIQSIGLMKIYVSGTSKDQVCKRKKLSVTL